MEESQQWRDVGLVQPGIGATKFVSVSQQVMTMLVIRVPEVLGLVEAVDVTELELDKLVLLSLVEPVQLLTLDDDAISNRIFVIGTHLCFDVFQERRLLRRLPSVIHQNIEERLEIFDDDGAGLAVLIYTEHLDREG